MDIVCESCGVANEPGTEFCLFCGNYLAWDRSGTGTRTASAAPPAATASAEGAPTEDAPTEDPPGPFAVASAGGPTTADLSAGPVRAPVSSVSSVSSVGTAEVPTAPQPAVDRGAGCPACGRVNDPGRRFCAKCGQVLGGRVTAAPSTHPSTWERVLRSRDRAARIAYRRSLPPLYRWRRVLIGVVVVALGIAGLTAVGRHPVRWGVDRFDDLRGTTVIVSGVQVAVEPSESTAAGSTPAALTDVTQAAWTMTWKPADQGVSCGGAPGTGVIVLTIPSTRIRAVDLDAGLVEANANRLLQFRPKSIGISFDGGPCHSFPLQDADGRQSLKVDSGVEVTTVRIGVDTAYAARDDGQALLSITEIFLRSRPPR